MNAVVHPHVYDLIDAAYKKAMNSDKYNIFIVDAALVYESGLDSHLDYVIVVTAQLKSVSYTHLTLPTKRIV